MPTPTPAPEEKIKIAPAAAKSCSSGPLGSDSGSQPWFAYHWERFLPPLLFRTRCWGRIAESSQDVIIKNCQSTCFIGASYNISVIYKLLWTQSIIPFFFPFWRFNGIHHIVFIQNKFWKLNCKSACASERCYRNKYRPTPFLQFYIF